MYVRIIRIYRTTETDLSTSKTDQPSWRMAFFTVHYVPDILFTSL